MTANHSSIHSWRPDPEHEQANKPSSTSAAFRIGNPLRDAWGMAWRRPVLSTVSRLGQCSALPQRDAGDLDSVLVCWCRNAFSRACRVDGSIGCEHVLLRARSRGLPGAPTLAEVVAGFRVPVMSLVSQPAVEVRSVSTTAASMNGEPTLLTSVSLSYTFWQVPEDHADPANLADLAAVDRAALNAPPIRPLPDWMMAQRELMHYPMLWEAVMTTRPSDDGRQTPESTLVDHVNYIVMNTFREQRTVGGFPGELDSPATKKHIEHTPVRVDGAELPGIRLDTDPNVYGVGVALGDRILTAVISRDHLADITIAFATLASHPPAS